LRRRAVPQRPSRLHLIVLDTSGSMQRGARLALAKGYTARLIEQAARAGEHVALLAFGGQGVQLLLPPGPARASGAGRVRPLAGGGGTPLAAALAQADRLAAQALRRGVGGACLWLLTDGRTLASPPAPQIAQQVIVDFDDPLRPAGRCPAWAAAWGADYRLPA
jgi:magnesium chelatase subunit ChlD-like protein